MDIKTALVVDDSRVARLTLSKLLQGRGIGVEQVNSAHEALDYLKDNHPDVIFMDFMMPDMDGLEATRLISANPTTAAIPVIICTAEEAAGVTPKVNGNGVWGFLPKPTPEERLDSVLGSLNGKAAATKPAISTPTASAITLQDVEQKAREIVEDALRRAGGELKRLADESVRAALDARQAALERSLLEATDKKTREIVHSLAEKMGARATHTAESAARREAEEAGERLAETIRGEVNNRLDQFMHDGVWRKLLVRVAAEAAERSGRNAAETVAAQVAEAVAGDAVHNLSVQTVSTQEQDQARAEAQFNAVGALRREAQQALAMAKKLLLVSAVVLLAAVGSSVLAFL